MKTAVFAAILILIGLSGCATTPESTATAVVAFTNPEKFTDFKYTYSGSDKERDALQKEFTEYIQKLARFYLRDGETLTLTFTDIDMAGDFEPWRNPAATDIRFMKDIYPPRLTFTYRVTDASGKTVKEDKKELSDMSYLMRVRIPDNDLLRFEKTILDDWARSDIRDRPKSS